MAAVKGGAESAGNKGWETQRHKTRPGDVKRQQESLGTGRGFGPVRYIQRLMQRWVTKTPSACDPVCENHGLHSTLMRTQTLAAITSPAPAPPPALNASLVARIPGRNDVWVCALRWMNFHFLWLTAALMLTSVQFALQILLSKLFQNEIIVPD